MRLAVYCVASSSPSSSSADFFFFFGRGGRRGLFASFSAFAFAVAAALRRFLYSLNRRRARAVDRVKGGMAVSSVGWRLRDRGAERVRAKKNACASEKVGTGGGSHARDDGNARDSPRRACATGSAS